MTGAALAEPIGEPMDGPRDARAAARGGAALIGLGLAVLYAPLLYTVAQLYWSQGESTHAPVLLAGILYGIWESRALFTWRDGRAETSVAALLMAGGLVVYALALLLGFFDLAFATTIPIGVGAILLAGGWHAVRRLWPLEIALLFAIPISDSSLDGAFLPAKILLTKAVVALLAHFGYPVADSGAVISIGFRTLLIANACTGLASLWALLSVGLLYVFFTKPESPVITALLLLAAAPLAVLANFVRLIVLVLVTHYKGSAAGAAFHQYAAYFEVAFSILMFIALDAALRRLLRTGRHAR